jgi:hypothetical protein
MCTANACEAQTPLPDTTVCDLVGVDDGVCDGLGTCVECNLAADCPDDSEQCTSAPMCTANACEAQTPLPDTTVCDLVGVDDGLCDGLGACVSS